MAVASRELALWSQIAAHRSLAAASPNLPEGECELCGGWSFLRPAPGLPFSGVP